MDDPRLFPILIARQSCYYGTLRLRENHRGTPAFLKDDTSETNARIDLEQVRKYDAWPMDTQERKFADPSTIPDPRN